MLYKCKKCNKAFMSKTSLNKHVNGKSKCSKITIKLPEPSKEQKKIKKWVKNKHNIIVNAVAGSGKTTTILHIANSMKNKKILLITYNAKLKLETREKAVALGLENFEVHSYHSFCVKNYADDCFTDGGIIKFFKKEEIKKKLLKYDLLIIDEAQDMTPLYYRIISKGIKDINNKKLQLCVTGDKNQSIYDFNKADNRFIVLANKLYPQVKGTWKSCKLSCNFRTTKQIASFINVCALRENRLVAIKDGEKVKYIICDAFDKKLIFDEIKECLTKYKVEDIFIIAPSVKAETTPVRQCANYLSSKNIDVYVPSSDDEKIDTDLTKGKIVFSTYHQVKGLERKVILLFGFDASFFKYFERNKPQNICPNIIYVALTRAIEYMIIFHHYKHDYLPFVNKEQLKTHAIFIQDKTIDSNCVNKESTNIGVTKLTRHLPSDVLYDCRDMLKYKLVQKKGKNIKIKSKVFQSNGKCEAVSDITGIAIPAFYEYITTNKMTIHDKLPYEKVKKVFTCFPNNSYADYFNLSENNLNIERLLQFSNMYCCYRSGYIYKAIQIKKYDWLTKENLVDCLKRVKKYISMNAIYEESIQYHSKKYLRVIEGQIDCYDEGILWEFKCVGQLVPEHYIQLAIYAFIHRTQYIKKFYDVLDKLKRKIDYDEFVQIDKELDEILKRINCKYYLMNILTNEIYELNYQKSQVERMIKLIFKTKFGDNNDQTTNKQFINNMLNLASTYRD